MGKIRYLDGLRGVAILLVFMIHAGGWGLRSIGNIGNSIADHGKYGVTIFFVASAYVICLSASKAFEGEDYNWKAFYVRRFFRIAPMYFLTLVVSLLLRQPDAWPSTASIISHFTFLNVLYPRYANDILYVEWSIAVEMAFYAIFPLVLIASRRNLTLIAGAAIFFALPSLRHGIYALIGGDLFEFRHYTLPWHAYAFLCGVLAFHYRETLKNPQYFFVALAALAMQLIVGEGSWSGPVFAAVTAIVVIDGHHNGWSEKVLSFKPLTFIGKVSFSLYLIHSMCISVLGPYLSVPAAILLAYIGQRFVEAPFQSWSKTMFRKPSSSSAAP
ncbi:acyltransferase [Rhizobium sp. CG4]|jgi:peptidoglycan/LPS O-acetylase OafA/YrhL|uniref:acyltransferase family protein n=1 Tax=Rhizobium sp. CG4 TaxID=2726075 RepID=UPI0020336C56|nr:acyltransferase [Rhizobium sp. CG4]MCM2454919.1 acyltransferase [Rhizobium sp. CG4]